MCDGGDDTVTGVLYSAKLTDQTSMILNGDAGTVKMTPILGFLALENGGNMAVFGDSCFMDDAFRSVTQSSADFLLDLLNYTSSGVLPSWVLSSANVQTSASTSLETFKVPVPKEVDDLLLYSYTMRSPFPPVCQVAIGDEIAWEPMSVPEEWSTSVVGKLRRVTLPSSCPGGVCNLWDMRDSSMQAILMLSLLSVCECC